jgi:hypothetical protein
MDVSIIIVSYNTARLLEECITSINSQTSIEFEIIVVDNNSTDNTIEMLNTKHSDVICIENKVNRGFARANNQGFSRATGKYFFMLNPDTLVLDKSIDKLISFMEANPDIGICGPRNEDCNGNLQYSCDHFPSFWNSLWSYSNLTNYFPNVSRFRRNLMKYWDYSEQRDVERIMGCALMIRSDLFRHLGGLDDNYFMYFEETDLCYQANRAGYRTVYFPESRIIHYGGESSKSQKEEKVINTTITSYHYESQYYFYRKNYGLIPMIMIRTLDFGYGIALLLRNLFRKDKARRSFNLYKAHAILGGALGVGYRGGRV